MPVKQRALASNSSFNVTVVRMISSISTYESILASNDVVIDAALVEYVVA